MSAQKPSVKTRLETRHFFALHSGNAEELVAQVRKERYREYDEKGNIVLEINYDPMVDDRVLEERYSTYNDAGHLIEEKVNHPADDYEEHRTFEVDETGKVVQSLQHYEDGTFDTVAYEYDDKKRIVGRTVTDSDGEHDGKEIWSYSEHNSVEKRYFDYMGEEEKVERIGYDANGNEILQLVEEFGDTSIDIKHTYNEANKLVATSISDGRGATQIAYTYGDNGEVVSEEYHDQDGTLIQRSELLYDENNLLIEEQRSLWIGESTRKQSRKYAYELY